MRPLDRIVKIIAFPTCTPRAKAMAVGLGGGIRLELRQPPSQSTTVQAPSTSSSCFLLTQLLSTPLHVAVRTGHVEIVEYFLSLGLDINVKDRVSGFPLAQAHPRGTGILRVHTCPHGSC